VNDGRTVVLHNNNKVQTGKGSQKQNVHFYYLYDLGANQPVPLVATKQDFYQAIWDAPERSNCSLKQIVPQAKKASTPPTKKAKASSARAVLPSFSMSSMPSSSPESFEAANRMVQEASKVAFPSLRFPVKLIGLFPVTKLPLVAVQHHEPPASTR
jgi:hypothetical protein